MEVKLIQGENINYDMMVHIELEAMLNYFIIQAQGGSMNQIFTNKRP